MPKGKGSFQLASGFDAGILTDFSVLGAEFPQGKAEDTGGPMPARDDNAAIQKSRSRAGSISG